MILIFCITCTEKIAKFFRNFYQLLTKKVINQYPYAQHIDLYVFVHVHTRVYMYMYIHVQCILRTMYVCAYMYNVQYMHGYMYNVHVYACIHVYPIVTVKEFIT